MGVKRNFVVILTNFNLFFNEKSIIICCCFFL